MAAGEARAAASEARSEPQASVAWVAAGRPAAGTHES
jgi:hypothetical protein